MLQNLSAHGRQILADLQNAVAKSKEQNRGTDGRALIAFNFADDLSLDEIGTVAGVELVSQEAGRVVLAFASEEGLALFERRLLSLIDGDSISREALIFAIDGIREWTAADRTGRALSVEGTPTVPDFAVDAELWPLEGLQGRRLLEADFKAALAEADIEILDRVSTSSTTAYRLRVDRRGLAWLLNHRDVRRVDLPPRWEVTRAELADRLYPLPMIARVDEDSERIAVLDTGVVEGHPLIAPSLGDAQSFYSAEALPATDDHGHGTFVGALAAFGDLSKEIVAGLSCKVVLLSGRVLDSRAEYIAGIGVDLRYDATIIANDVRRAVEHFKGTYDCRVYCLSFGDRRHPYRGGHLDGLAVALDEFAREFQCLFVVSAGNIAKEDIPQDAREAYPEYLLDLDNRIIDPASALNVITVGSLARREATDYQIRYRNDLREVPIARVDEPSPFTRSGPSIANVIKPDVVFYGGNFAVRLSSTGLPLSQGLGEVSARIDVSSGQLLGEMCGTSVAAPVIAHFASQLLAVTPDRDPMLARAMIAAHSRVPRSARSRLNSNRDKLLNIVGYGLPDFDQALRSTNRVLTLYAKDAIDNRTNHFYELPIPTEFFSGARRSRRISVALSHFASMRSTRLEYKEQRLSFKLVPGALDHVAQMFNAATSEEAYENIKEVAYNGSVGSRRRSKGTLQACLWTLTVSRDEARGLVLVVTRNDRIWAASEEAESYALAIVIDDRLNAEARLHAYAQVQLGIALRVRT